MIDIFDNWLFGKLHKHCEPECISSEFNIWEIDLYFSFEFDLVA